MPARYHATSAQTYSVTLFGQPEDKLESTNGHHAVADKIQIEYFQIGEVHSITVNIDAEWDTGGLFRWHRTGSELGDVPMWLKMEIGRHQPRWCKARIPGQQ